ncbi:YhcN/YlaJ family sporulation lipoprotein [Tissierella creatinophila]|uniref:Lipoprotein YhcN n=1 Tax=Tissierella creatinophila DSM 6911 TaxID=1123403 RepID=A0A1U7M9E2_TISCR|nr:YhcN/YlaJ family sporulation lipoprotein [Tissierella creatinophila]OLS03917.1 lipoprotein YhcN precursor [Tissierella creatinophila DSM 6911]
MKKNKIFVLALSLGLMFTSAACTTKNPKVSRNTNRNLSTQTRDNRWNTDRNLTGTDTVRDNTRNNMGINESIDVRENVDINNRDKIGLNNPLNDNVDMGLNNGLRNGLDTNINNGMTRPNNVNTQNTTNLSDISSMNKDASKIAKKIADLNEVNKASVLITENEAVVGVNLRGNTQGTMTNDLRQKIEKIVKNEDKSIDKISITTDPNLVTRINTMTTNIGNGNIVDNFAQEVKDLIRRITPNSMK